MVAAGGVMGGGHAVHVAGGGGGAVGGGGVVGGGGGGCGGGTVACGPVCGGVTVQGCGGGCVEADYDEKGLLSFVGTGQGDYRAETTYKYVGSGAGEFEMVTVPTKFGPTWCYCLIIIPLILLILFLIPMLSSSDTTTTTHFDPPPPIIITTTPPPPPLIAKSCSIFGDPHATTFDGMHSDYYSSGEFWIVKSTDVLIQGKYAPTHATNGLSVTKQIAVSGSFLHGHKLIVGEEHATWDGHPILTTFPCRFEDKEGLVTIVYDSQGELLQPGREGKSLHVLHITLPGHVTMQINRWNEEGEGRYINTKITMPKQPQQDGQCGNFNGNAADDARLAVKARLGKDGVAAEDLLFPGPKTPIDQGIESCSDANLVKAHAECKAVTSSFWPSMACLKTVCNGGVAAPDPPVAAPAIPVPLVAAAAAPPVAAPTILQ
jgi:hypothetical protein